MNRRTSLHGILLIVILGCVGRNATTPNAVQLVETTDQKRERARADLQTASSEYDRWLALTDLVLLEAANENVETVRNHLVELTTLSEKYRLDWNYGNAVHKAHLSVGRLALREGNVEAAKTSLLSAGKTPGSPQLNSFGPNMALARELFRVGERDAVLQYLELCRAFWEDHDSTLDEWISQVKANTEPDFGANLVY